MSNYLIFEIFLRNWRLCKFCKTKSWCLPGPFNFDQHWTRGQISQCYVDLQRWEGPLGGKNTLLWISLTSVPGARCACSHQPPTPSSCMAGAGPACVQRPASPDTASGVGSSHKAMSASHWLSHKHIDTVSRVSRVSLSVFSFVFVSPLCSATNKSANLVMMWSN